jgi:hypothetical protein
MAAFIPSETAPLPTLSSYAGMAPLLSGDLPDIHDLAKRYLDLDQVSLACPPCRWGPRRSNPFERQPTAGNTYDVFLGAYTFSCCQASRRPGAGESIR